MGMKLEIDMADLGWTYDEEGEPIGRATLEDRIVEAAAMRVLSSENTLRDLRQRVMAIVEQEATDQVREAVREVLAGPIQKSTPWGEKTGEVTSVKEIIREKVEAFMKAPAAQNSYRNAPSNLTELITESVKNILTGELASTVKDAKTQIHQRVTKAAINAAVQELAR